MKTVFPSGKRKRCFVFTITIFKRKLFSSQKDYQLFCEFLAARTNTCLLLVIIHSKLSFTTKTSDIVFRNAVVLIGQQDVTVRAFFVLVSVHFSTGLVHSILSPHRSRRYYTSWTFSSSVSSFSQALDCACKW